MKYEIIASHRFKKSFRKLKKSGDFDIENYNEIVNLLKDGTTLPTKYHDHQLQGDWAGYRECHIESNTLLIYEIDQEIESITLVDIGSHAYLFE